MGILVAPFLLAEPTGPLMRQLPPQDESLDATLTADGRELFVNGNNGAVQV